MRPMPPTSNQCLLMWIAVRPLSPFLASLDLQRPKLSGHFDLLQRFRGRATPRANTLGSVVILIQRDESRNKNAKSIPRTRYASPAWRPFLSNRRTSATPAGPFPIPVFSDRRLAQQPEL